MDLSDRLFYIDCADENNAFIIIFLEIYKKFIIISGDNELHNIKVERVCEVHSVKLEVESMFNRYSECK